MYPSAIQNTRIVSGIAADLESKVRACYWQLWKWKRPQHIVTLYRASTVPSRCGFQHYFSHGHWKKDSNMCMLFHMNATWFLSFYSVSDNHMRNLSQYLRNTKTFSSLAIILYWILKHIMTKPWNPHRLSL